MVDRLMAEAHSYSPREVDRLSVRDLAVMLHAALNEQEARWQRMAELSSQVYNMGGPRGEDFTPKSAADLYPELFHGDTESWEDEVADAFERYNPD